jgi:hypothetical protein
MKVADEKMSTLEASSNCLLVFVDETGHEDFADKEHPVFGMGGCATINSLYNSVIRKPWLELKAKSFGGADTPLHASELHNPSPDQIKGLCNYFQANKFFRLYEIIKSTTPFPKDLVPYQIIAMGLLERIREIATMCPLDSIAMIFESSERADNLIGKYFSAYQFEIDGKAISFDRYRMLKTSKEAGLEVADFIIHTAGAQVRARMNNNSAQRKDYACVFSNIDKCLVSSFEIEYVHKNEGEGIC